MARAASIVARIRESSVEVAAIVAVTGLGALLTFPSIGRRPLWNDEVFSVSVVRRSWNDLLGAVADLDGGNMAAYYLVLRAWSNLGDSEALVRSLSAGFMLAAIPVVYVLGRRLGGLRVGLLGALLFTTNAFVVRYAQEARGYSLAMLTACVATLLLLRLVEHPTTAGAIGYGLVVSIGLFSHFFMGFVLAAHVASLAFAPKAALDRARLTVVAAPIAVCITVIVALRLRGPLNDLSFLEPLRWYSFRNVATHLTGTNHDLVGLDPLAYVLVAAYTVLAGAGVIALVRNASERTLASWRTTVLAAWLLVPLVAVVGISLVRPMLNSRYLGVVVPPMTLMTAWTLVRIPWRRTALLATAAMLALSMQRCLGLVDAPPAEDWRSAAEHLRHEATPDDGLIVVRHYGRVPLDHYLARTDEGLLPTPLHPTTPLFERDAQLYLADIDDEVAAPAAARDANQGRVWLAMYDGDVATAASTIAELEKRYELVETERFVRVELRRYDQRST